MAAEEEGEGSGELYGKYMTRLEWLSRLEGGRGMEERMHSMESVGCTFA